MFSLFLPFGDVLLLCLGDVTLFLVKVFQAPRSKSKERNLGRGRAAEPVRTITREIRVGHLRDEKLLTTLLGDDFTCHNWLTRGYIRS